MTNLFLAFYKCGVAKSHVFFLMLCNAGYQEELRTMELSISPRGNGDNDPLLWLLQMDTYSPLLMSAVFSCPSHSLIFTLVVPVHSLFSSLCTVFATKCFPDENLQPRQGYLLHSHRNGWKRAIQQKLYLLILVPCDFLSTHYFHIPREKSKVYKWVLLHSVWPLNPDSAPTSPPCFYNHQYKLSCFSIFTSHFLAWSQRMLYI